MTTTTHPMTSPPTRHVPRLGVGLTILGAVCGAVVPAVLTAGDVPGPAKLAGMALGAALPPLIGAAGARPRLRVAVVAMTVAALALSYSGLQIFAKVTETAPAVPSPSGIVDGLPWVGDDRDHEVDGQQACGDPLVHGTDELGLAVCPPALTCRGDDGCDPVTVTSLGTAPLRIGEVELGVDAATYLTATGCAHTVLAKGQDCTITVTFSPEKAPEAATTELVVHQNLPENPIRVPLRAEGTVTGAAALALGEPVCDLDGLTPDPDGGVSGWLIVEAPLTATGVPDGVSLQAAVHVDGQFLWPAEVDLAGARVRAEEFYSGPPLSVVAIIIDPNGLVEGDDLEDNRRRCP